MDVKKYKNDEPVEDFVIFIREKMKIFDFLRKIIFQSDTIKGNTSKLTSF